MKKIILIVALAVVIAAMITSCAAPALEMKNDGMYDPSTKVQYSFAPSNYGASGWLKEVYAKDSAGFSYYQLTASDGGVADGSLYLYDKDNKQLIYNSDSELPDLGKLDPDAMFFGIEGNIFVKIAEESDKNAIDVVVDIYNNAPSCAYTAAAPDSYYVVVFTSSAYPYLTFRLFYIEYSRDIKEFETVSSLEGYTFREGVPYETFEESDGRITVEYNYGKYFLYDRETERCYMARHIHDTYNAIN